MVVPVTEGETFGDRHRSWTLSTSGGQLLFVSKNTILWQMMTRIDGKIMKMVIITSMMTETHRKNRKNGHHNIDDDQNS